MFFSKNYCHSATSPLFIGIPGWQQVAVVAVIAQ